MTHMLKFGACDFFIRWALVVIYFTLQKKPAKLVLKLMVMCVTKEACYPRVELCLTNTTNRLMTPNYH